MSIKTLRNVFLLVLCLVIFKPAVKAETRETDQTILVSLQKRLPSEAEEGAFIIVNEMQEWKGNETAIIICDMWDKHWCTGATGRVAEMAPFMNTVVSIAREKGVQIVHAPSDCMGYYKDHQARKLGKKYKFKSVEGELGDGILESEAGADWPFEISGGGCDDKPQCEIGKAWTKQIETIEISDGDIITDSGVEAGSLFKKKGIKNVILVGVHTNMCVIGRSFGLRNMTRLGMNVVLMRDMTDTMYDSASWPNVSHFTGNSLMHEYIEKYVCPTMVSSDFTGHKQFRFENDTRPVVAFVTADGEYRANQRLPEFAHDLLLTKNVNCEFALGKPATKGEGRHNIENLQILNDADIAVFFVRRRALEPEKLAMIKNFVTSGKPVLGIRTASHAFAAKENITRKNGGIVSDTGKTSEFLSVWPEFDEEILGGNYHGHYGHLDEGCDVSIVPGMEKHPLLKGVDPEGFISLCTLYKNRPLRSGNAQVLLVGTIPGQPSEPVFWVNKNKYGNVIYTALGHWDDWKIESFKNIMINSVDYFLDEISK
ncbi:MAG: isochorismatase family protein [Bacteroidales bacterium]|nr:isochorismatase family protein [Bacteroidales bacterium]